MLSDFKTYGTQKGYFVTSRIGSFPNATKEGFAHVNTKGINFDETKNILCRELGLECCKSCDALDIISSKNRLNLIEFKKLVDNATIEDWITELNLAQKIKDSRDILMTLVKKTDFKSPEKVSRFNSCEKNVIIVFDLIDDATKKLALLQRYAVVKAHIEKQFHDNYIEGETFKQPKCVRMHEFDSKYGSSFA